MSKEKSKKGWPKGKPRKKKVSGDVSRTPKDTMSFVSMVTDERPVLKDTFALEKLLPSPGTDHQESGKLNAEPETSQEARQSKWKLKPESLAYDNLYKSYVCSNINSATSLTQLAALKIQKKAHLQHKQQHTSSQSESNEKNEFDLTDIALSKSTSPLKSQTKRKNLDFITSRLKYKKKMEALKAQNAESKRILQPSYPVQTLAQPTLPARLISPPMNNHVSSQNTPTSPEEISTPGSSYSPLLHLQHPPSCKCWNCFHNGGKTFTIQPSAVPAQTLPPQLPSVGHPQPACSMVITSSMMTPTPLTEVPVVPKSSSSPAPQALGVNYVKQEPTSPGKTVIYCNKFMFNSLLNKSFASIFIGVYGNDRTGQALCSSSVF